MEALLKIKDVAKLIGLHENTVYKLTYRDEIPYVKIGRQVRFKESAILAWINKSSHDKIIAGK